MRPLHVRQIEVCNFTTHTNTTFTLPERGVVLITGPNGSGKTSLCQAVATAGWNESIRGGRAPWREKLQCLARITTDRLVFTASATPSGKVSVVWNRIGEPESDWETPTKARNALAEEIGPFELWYQTHVFSADTARAFADATDAARKRALEALLGVTSFDDALGLCREELKVASDILRTATTGLRAAEAAEKAVRDAMEDPPEDTPTPDEIKAAEEALGAAEEALAVCKERVTELVHLGADLRVARDTLTRQLSELDTTPAVCPTCGQDWRHEDSAESEAHRAARAAELNAALADITAKSAKHRSDTTAATSASSMADREVRARRAAVSNLDHLVAAAGGYATRYAAWEARCAAHKEAVRVATECVETATHDVDVLKAAAEVLGVKGARGAVLAEALPVLSDAATAWIRRLGRAWGLRIAPTSTTKSGDVSEALALVLDAPGRGGTYTDLSRGEQKRVQLALLFALGELAQAGGGEPGTLWVDEALDAPLDEDGAAAASECLRELAANRCVVVIAHSPAVARVLGPDQHYEFEDGTVRRLR